MSVAERYKGYAAWNVDGAYDGRCLGGPYDGQRLQWKEPRFPIQMYCSTAEYPADVMQKLWDNMHKYNNTSYVFQDSTWVWKSERN